jgi:hypothetical protein
MRLNGLSLKPTYPRNAPRARNFFAIVPGLFRALHVEPRASRVGQFMSDGLARNQAVTHTTGSHAFATLKLTIALIHQAVFKDSLNGACGLLGLC